MEHVRARARATCVKQWAKRKNCPGKPWASGACGCVLFFTFVLLTTLRQLGGRPCERGVRSTFTQVVNRTKVKNRPHPHAPLVQGFPGQFFLFAHCFTQVARARARARGRTCSTGPRVKSHFCHLLYHPKKKKLARAQEFSPLPPSWRKVGKQDKSDE